MTGGFAFILPFLTCLLLFRRIEPAGLWLTALACAAPLAIGASSLTWWFLLHLSIPSRRSLIVLDAMIWLAALLVLVRSRAPVTLRSTPVAASDGTMWIAGTTLAITLVVAATSFAGASAVYPHGEWDAWAIWNLRARFLSRLEPFEWPDAFPPVLTWSHLDYPSLLPLSVARAWTYGGGESTAIPIALAAIFAFSAAILAGTAVARRGSRSRGLLTAAAILASPAFVRYAPSQCSDIPLAFYVLATCVLLTRAYETPSDRLPWLLAGASAGLAAWTKNEGILFLATCFAVVGIRSIYGGGRNRSDAVVRLLVGASPMIVAVFLLKLITPSSDLAQAAALPSMLSGLNDGNRVQTVLVRISAELWFGGATRIGVLPLVAAFVAVVGVRRNANPGPLIGLVAVGLLIVGYAAVYVVTPHDLTWHMDTSLDRVMLHVFPALVWCAMMIARE